MIKKILFSTALTLSGLAHSQVTSGLVAKYSFNNGNANDEIGTNHGIVNGAALTTDRFGNAGKAYIFDGINDLIDFGNSSTFQMGQNDFSISLWIESSVSQFGPILNKRNDSPSFDQYSINLGGYSSPSNNVSFYYKPSPGGIGALERAYTHTVVSSAWQHIVIVHSFTGSTSMYINNQFVGSSNTTFSSENFNIVGANLIAGFTNVLGTNYYFNGKLDDIAIYNRTLTLNEVSNLYTEPNPVVSLNNGLAARYSFNNSNANDESGNNNHGTVNGATLTTDRFGNTGKAYSFNGTSSYIDFGDAPEFKMGNNDFSISLWVNYSATQQANIISKRSGLSSNFNMYTISILNDPQFGGASQNVWHFSRSSNSNDRDINAGNLAGAWHHITLVHNYSDSTSVFIDGQFVGSDLNTVSGVYDITGYPLVLGYASEANSNFYNGIIDDVNIYNRILTPAEVTALFNEPNPVSGLVAKYSFNNSNANDESGNNNHGVINGATLTNDRFGNSNKAYQFMQNQTITIADADTLDEMTTGMAVSFWVKLPPIVSNSNNLISKFSFCGGGTDAYNIRVNTNGKIWAQIDDMSGFDSYQTGSVTVADNNWHHIVLDWNKPNVVIYVDGVADVSGSYTSFNSTISNSPDVLAFGQVISDFCGANYEYGEQLDDISIYNRSLTSVEVMALFNDPNPATVGVNEIISNQLSKVFPNPNNGDFTIQSQIADVVNVTNELGQVIETIELNQQNNFSCKVNSLQSGIYFIVGKTIKQKVVVTK